MRKHYCLNCKKEFDYVGECPHCGTHLVGISEAHRIERRAGIGIFVVTLLLLAYRTIIDGWSLFSWVAAFLVLFLGVGIVVHENLLYELVYKDYNMRDEKTEYYWIVWMIWVFVLAMFLFILTYFIRLTWF